MDLKRKFIDRTASLSEKIAGITARARRGEEAVNAALAKIDDVLTAAQAATAATNP